MEEELREAVRIIDKYIEGNVNNITYDLNTIIEPGQKQETKRHVYLKAVNRMKRLDSALKSIEQIELTINMK